MKYLSLVWAALRRKPARTLLTFFAIASAFVLFGMLQGFAVAINEGLAATKADRLITASRVSLREGLPISHLARIRSVPGVVAVGQQASFVGNYRNRRVQGSAVDPATFFPLFDEIRLPKNQLETMMKIRTGVVIGDIAARRYGWKIGDHISLRSFAQANRLGSQQWELDVVGIYDVPEKPVLGSFVIMNYAYFDEARFIGNGTVDLYFVRVSDPSEAPAVAQAIDRIFENSAYETRTMTENEFAQSFLQSIGDLDFVVRAVIAAVFVSLLFSTSLVLIQSIRERTEELAILKTLGFSGRSLLGLILAESLFVCVLAAMLGLGIAGALFPLATASINIALASLPLSVIAVGIGFAVGLALLTGVVPAWLGMRLQIVDAIRRS
jgi:putative ABC transport system permease protein